MPVAIRICLKKNGFPRLLAQARNDVAYEILYSCLAFSVVAAMASSRARI